MLKTANLGLNKPEGNNVADIYPAVDENMDILDSVIGGLETKVENLNLDAENVKFTSSITAFTQKNVKLALDYLFQLANNGKQYWVDVVGWPLAITDSFATLKSKTQSIKNTIATNIVSKGVAANSADSLTSLSDAISRISIESLGGLRYKRIEYTPSDIIIVNNGNGITGTAFQKTLPISFTPKFIIINIQHIKGYIDFIQNDVTTNKYDDHTETEVELDTRYMTYDIYYANTHDTGFRYVAHDKYLDLWSRATTILSPIYVDIIY